MAENKVVKLGDMKEVTKINCEDISEIFIVPKGMQYPFTEEKPKETTEEKPKEGTEAKPEETKPETTEAPKPAETKPAETKPADPAPAPAPAPAEDEVMKKDLQELSALKTTLSNKIIGEELKANSDLDVKTRTDELTKLPLSDLTTQILKLTSGNPAGEKAKSDLTLAGKDQGMKPQGLRDIIKLGLDAEVL